MCSYCGCADIEVVGRFLVEHEAVVNACGDLRRACAGVGTDVTKAVDDLLVLLRPHTRAEEVGLFAVLAEDVEFTDHVHGLCAEHDRLETLLAAVRAGDHDLVHETERLLRAHIDREENGLFPAAAIAFAGPEWQRVTDLTPPAGPR